MTEMEVEEEKASQYLIFFIFASTINILKLTLRVIVVKVIQTNNININKTKQDTYDS